MRGSIVISVLFAIFAWVGCAVPFVKVDNAGLTYSNNEIAVLSTSPERLMFINGNWYLENWKANAGDTVWTRKRSKKYQTEISFDLTEDGKPDVRKQHIFELELKHIQNGAVILLDVIPVKSSMSKIRPKTLLADYVESLSGSESWRSYSRFSGILVKERSYATKLVDSKPMNIQGLEGIVAKVEIANLSQLRLDEQHRSKLLSVLIVKIPNFKVHNASRGWVREYPAIMSVVLAADPDDYESVQADFVTFLGAISIHGKRWTPNGTFFEGNHLPKM